PHSDRPGQGRRSRATSSSSVILVAGPSKASNNDDPLAEFYAKARAEAETEWARQGEVPESEAPPSDTDAEESVIARGPPNKRGWTCDAKEIQRKTCVNQDVIDKYIQLKELKTLHVAKLGEEDCWWVFSYSKCKSMIRNVILAVEMIPGIRAVRGSAIHGNPSHHPSPSPLPQEAASGRRARHEGAGGPEAGSEREA
ncbi:hypothetical protein C0995_015876, partial [Termitomyces sp. Mi166